MVAFNELSFPPDAMHNVAHADARGVHTALEECINHTIAHDGDSTVSTAAGDCPDGLILTTPRAVRRDKAERILRAVVKPLIALAMAPYVLVTALAVLTALLVGVEAGKAINAKLEPVIAALKRL